MPGPAPAYPTAPLTRRTVLGLLAASLATPLLGKEPAEPTPEAILAHPERFDPFTYAILVKGLWQQGRRQQATFWFYVFQIRTRPWAQADKRGDGAAALRASLNETLGSTINLWVASDLAAWQAIAARAVAYEARLPLYPGQPDGISTPAWQTAVRAAREEYASQMRQAFASLTPEDHAARRREAGLPVGPLQDPGPPLPAAWA